MDLQELLGADFKDGITAEEVNSIMEKRLLASGKYENKEKVDAERKANKQKVSDLEAKIKGKMSDDELSKQELEDLKKQLQEALDREAASKKGTSKLMTERNMAEAKTILEIKDNDKEFAEFMEIISGEDNELSDKTSNYVMKLIKDAYEKGKAQATKTTLGQMGEQIIGKDGKMMDKDEAFVKGLLSINPKPNANQKSNFI
jgi:hypothetical protein